MNTAPISLKRYVSAPASAVELEMFPQETAACFAPFFALRSELGPWKWQAVTAARDALIEKRCLADFSVQLQWKRKTEAYMNDAGQVYLSAGLLATSSAMTVLSVYCHELAHIKLSQREDYPAIKALQREFKQHFKHHKQCELLSPIEFYAMLISRPLLSAMAENAHSDRQKKKLARLQEDLEQKIRLLEQQIVKLSEEFVT
ncbi:MAG: hypothetical protein IJW14_02825 [Oscillospiraceae bacterium]|nr:hypothetical protein [Oscillospiraceae bacterium]